VEADPMRLEQILVNLVDNGVKFNSKGGSVRVSCEESGDSVSIIVNDNGEGIAPEHLPRLFERFYRTDKARSREIGGTGLGLAICKHLARLHGGEMTVTSVAGQGSTFRLDLPKH
jgi:two-component system phosphate regulon sensor histidine kinase PhoR